MYYRNRPIGIIGALSSETELLISKLSNIKKTHMVGTTYYSGDIGGKPVIVVTCGMGKVNAACITQAMIQEFQVSAVINSGIAGGIQDGIKPCDIVISKDLVYHDFFTDEDVFKPFTADDKLINLAQNACKELSKVKNFSYFTGRIATGDQFIIEQSSKDRIKSECNPLCVEMEGGAIAHCCGMNDVPFVVIRAISDSADDDAVMTFYEFKEAASNISASIVLDMLKNL